MKLPVAGRFAALPFGGAPFYDSAVSSMKVRQVADVEAYLLKNNYKNAKSEDKIISAFHNPLFLKLTLQKLTSKATMLH